MVSSLNTNKLVAFNILLLLPVSSGIMTSASMIKLPDLYTKYTILLKCLKIFKIRLQFITLQQILNLLQKQLANDHLQRLGRKLKIYI